MSKGSSSAADMLVGRTLDGKYRIEEFIGRGAMGLVFRATQLDVEKPVALKIMRSDVMSDDTSLQRFYREARATSKLNHPNTIKVFESGRFADVGHPYIAMEYLDGEPLHKVLAASKTLPAYRVVRILVQVAKSLAEAHKENIVHRDLKPGNIMIMQLFGEDDFVKVLDFGIAKILTDTASQALTQAGFALGTPHYMSPEQAKGRSLDARTDLYSLGVIMFELLVGRVPFQGDSSIDVIMKHLSEPPPALWADAASHPLTAKVVAVMQRLIVKDRDQRTQSAVELIQELTPLNVEGQRQLLSGDYEHVSGEELERGGGAAAPPRVETLELDAEGAAALGIVPAPAPAPKPAPAAAAPVPEPELVAERTMALSADDVAELSAPTTSPRRGTASLSTEDLVEKTMALSADDIPVATASAPASPSPAPEALDPERTMALDALDLAEASAEPAPAPAPEPAPVEPAPAEPAPAEPAPAEPEDAFEKTVSLNVDDLRDLVGAAPETASEDEDNSGESTMLLGIEGFDLPGIASPAASVEAEELTGEAAERTMLFDQLDESLSQATAEPAPPSRAIPSSEIDALGGGDDGDRTMMFEQAQGPEHAVSQDDATMMFDAGSIPGVDAAPVADQHDSTVMLDLGAAGMAQSQQQAVTQDGATMMVDLAAAQAIMGSNGDGSIQEDRTMMGSPEDVASAFGGAEAGMDERTRVAGSTDPVGYASPGNTAETRLPSSSMTGTMLVWILIGLGSLAIVSAAVFLLLE